MCGACSVPFGAGHRSRLDRDHLVGAVAVLDAPATEATEARERRLLAVPVDVGEAAVRVGLPELDQMVGDELAAAVVDRAA